MYKFIKYAINYICAFFAVHFIYNSIIFQNLVKHYNLKLVHIIIALIIITFIALYILDITFNFIITLLFKLVYSIAIKKIKKKKPIQAMIWVKFYNIISDLYFMYKNNTIKFNGNLDYTEKFKNLCEKDFRFNIHNIFKILSNYIVMVCILYVLYKRTWYIETGMSHVKNFISTNLDTIKLILTKIPVLTIITPILLAIVFIGRRNITKNYLNKYEEKIEEEVIIKIKDFCTYFTEDKSIILKNLYYLIAFRDFFEAGCSDETITYTVRATYVKLKKLKNTNKLKELIKYLIKSKNAKYFFEFCNTRKNFLLFFAQVNLILLIDQDLMLDMLFDTELYVSNRYKNVDDIKRNLIIEDDYFALMLLDNIICFINEFSKYTKSGFIDKNIRPIINDIKRG